MGNALRQPVRRTVRELSRSRIAKFGKHPDLSVCQQEPLNAGPPLDLLQRNFITPEPLFFVRNHGNVPSVHVDKYELVLNGNVAKQLRLTYRDLQKSFPKVSVPAALACAGLRRDGLSAVRPIPNELPWGAEPVGNAEWSGVRLRDVLEAANPLAAAKHVAFTGLDQVERDQQKFGFGGSIPLEKALHPEVLLAYEMNGEPLTPLHGFPLRVVVPGFIGARSVKWLASITLQEEPSTNYFQQRAYKMFSPAVTPETAEWSSGVMLSEQVLNSVICTPAEGQVISEKTVIVRGFAFAGDTQSVQRVEISPDCGETWIDAKLHNDASRWTWALWEAQIELPRGEHSIVVRAWDSSGKTQPQSSAEIWNFKGYMNNSWHAVRVRKIDG